MSPAFYRLHALLKQCPDNVSVHGDIEAVVRNAVVLAQAGSLKEAEVMVDDVVPRIEAITGLSADFDGVIIPTPAPEVPTGEPGWSDPLPSVSPAEIQ